jgi:hypothetical protein
MGLVRIDLGLDFPQVIQDNSGEIRTYFSEDQQDKKYPSVTTILSKMASDESKEILNEWKKRIGEEEANKCSRRGINRGRKVHTLIENYFENNETIELDFVMPHIRGAFNSILLGIKKSLIDICLFEQNLISHTLKVGGRVDCIGFIRNGHLAIIDFKTSKRFKNIDDCYDYFIQTALYGIMLNEILEEQHKEIRVKTLVIIMSVDDQKEPLVFVELLANWETKAKKMIDNYWRKTNEQN